MPQLEVDSGCVQSFQERFGNTVGIGFHWFLWLCQVADNIPLARAGNFPIAQKGCQYLLVAQVLAPCLEMLRGLAYLLTEQGKGISETVRVEVRHPSGNESIFEYGADWGCGAPVLPVQTGGFKMAR